MVGSGWILFTAALLLLAAAVLIWRPIRLVLRETQFGDARRSFHRQRERLEAKFVWLAQTQAKPGAPRWLDCEFDDDVAYVRSRTTGELSALVAVTVTMEGSAAAGGETSEQEALRAATAVFRFNGNHWDTDGRAIVNLSPSEAIRFYQRDLKMVGQELAQRT
jgi:hypothetical protein